MKGLTTVARIPGSGAGHHAALVGEDRYRTDGNPVKPATPPAQPPCIMQQRLPDRYIDPAAVPFNLAHASAADVAFLRERNVPLFAVSHVLREETRTTYHVDGADVGHEVVVRWHEKPKGRYVFTTVKASISHPGINAGEPLMLTGDEYVEVASGTIDRSKPIESPASLARHTAIGRALDEVAYYLKGIQRRQYDGEPPESDARFRARLNSLLDT